MEAHNTTPSAVKRVGRFGLVGIVNTLIDYGLFIALTKALGLPLERVWVAKLISGSVAMAGSYLLNKHWVFKMRHTGHGAEAVRFVVVTALGVFVVQLGLVQLFASVIPQPGHLAYHILAALGVAHGFITRALVIKTVAFGLATLASLIWNYAGYRRVVFV
jgi:putative flippase GtrA